jgi:hypothetical protein
VLKPPPPLLHFFFATRRDIRYAKLLSLHDDRTGRSLDETGGVGVVGRVIVSLGAAVLAEESCWREFEEVSWVSNAGVVKLVSGRYRSSSWEGSTLVTGRSGRGILVGLV